MFCNVPLAYLIARLVVPHSEWIAPWRTAPDVHRPSRDGVTMLIQYLGDQTTRSVRARCFVYTILPSSESFLIMLKTEPFERSPKASRISS